MDLLKEVSEFIGEKIKKSEPLSGGKLLETSRKKYFFKCKKEASPTFFKEASGLAALKSTKAIDVVSVVHVTEHFILLEFVEPSPPRGDFFFHFGTQLACMHRHTSLVCGFKEDNFLGPSPQPNQNPRKLNWAAFFWEKRLLYQCHIGTQRGYIRKDLEKKLLAMESTVYDRLKISEPPSLLHGDLWSGNYLVNSKGKACLIDPAAYYGHREAELAMCRLFGGFSKDFYTGYEQEFPLEPGTEKRQPIYQLYHLLNHLNLFGQSYLPHVEAILN